MKNSIYFIAIILFLSTSCKTKQSINTNVKKQETAIIKGTNIGKVSHKFKASGCPTVIITKVEGQDKPLILIPNESLTNGLDVDGLEIYFDYHPLKMKNPDGCLEGIPAEITNISKK